MLDVQSLMNEIQHLSESVAWWNKLVIGGMAATAVAASFLVIAQLMVNTESKLLADTQDRLIKLKDEKLAAELSGKGLLIAEANERSANAEVRAAEANKKAEESRRDTAKHELELAAQRKLLADADERVAKAETRAAEAKLDLEKFKAPRTVSADQEAILIRELSQFSGEKLSLDAYSGSEEVERFARQLETAFKKAGIITNLRLVHAFGGARSGITANMGSDRQQFADGIGRALMSSKISEGPIRALGVPDAKELTLIIGHK